MNALKLRLFEREPFNKTRKLVVQQGKKYPEHAFHVISNLKY